MSIEVTCPNCGCEFQDDEPQGYNDGDINSICCPGCDKHLTYAVSISVEAVEPDMAPCLDDEGSNTHQWSNGTSYDGGCKTTYRECVACHKKEILSTENW